MNNLLNQSISFVKPTNFSSLNTALSRTPNSKRPRTADPRRRTKLSVSYDIDSKTFDNRPKTAGTQNFRHFRFKSDDISPNPRIRVDRVNAFPLRLNRKNLHLNKLFLNTTEMQIFNPPEITKKITPLSRLSIQGITLMKPHYNKSTSNNANTQTFYSPAYFINTMRPRSISSIKTNMRYKETKSTFVQNNGNKISLMKLSPTKGRKLKLNKNFCKGFRLNKTLDVYNEFCLNDYPQNNIQVAKKNLIARKIAQEQLANLKLRKTIEIVIPTTNTKYSKSAF